MPAKAKSRVLLQRNEDELVRAAMAAWFRSGEHEQPANLSYTQMTDGKEYVILLNVRGVMAVYRVRNDGVLKRLKRWPPEVVEGL